MKGALVLLFAFVSLALGGQFINFPYGGRANMLFIPSAANSSRPLPLFVMLHGCTQNPTVFAAGTKMNTYGEEYDLFVVYPEQPSSANIEECWNWFVTADQSRGSGEPALIVSIAQAVMAKYKIDNSSVFVAGLSAGAAMADIVGVTYPDIFRGVTVGSGLEYQAATSTLSAELAMIEGGPNPTTQGQVAYKAMGRYAETQLVLVTHGSADTTVAPVNGQQVTDSYAETIDLILGNGHSYGYITSTPTTTTDGQVPGGHSYTTYTYADSKTSQTFITYIVVNGMSHAWSGGSSSGTYTDPEGPDASLIMIHFFLNGTAPTTGSGTGSGSSSGPSSSGTGSSSNSTSGTGTGHSSSGSSSGGNNSSTVLTSIASEDGFVGKWYSDGYSTTICKVGTSGYWSEDDYRIILSFDSSSLPSSGPSSALLTITQVNLTGSLEPLIIDLKQGTFGESTTLSELAYYGIPTLSDVGLISVPGSNGATSTFQFPSDALTYMTNAATRIQVMIRQDIFTTLPTEAAAVLQIVDGGATLSLSY